MKNNTSFIIIFFILILFGLVMLASATSVVGYEHFDDNYYYLKHQLLYGLLPGLILFFICSRIKYTFWQKKAWLLLLITIILLILVFIPKIGYEINNAKSWIKIGEITFQPTEIAKLTFLIYLAAFFSRPHRYAKRCGQAKTKEHIKSFSHGLLPFLFLLGIIIGLTVLQPDIGTASIIILIAVGVFFTAGAKISHLIGLGVLGAGLFSLIIFLTNRLDRILAFLNPQANLQGAGYHINQSLIAVGSGGLLGLGLGRSRQKFEYLPEVAGDSIFAIMAEELGLIFCIFFVLLLIYFIFKILKISKHTNNDFVRLFTTGLAIWIGGQTLINISAMIGILPLTGIPLPFISYGGTALISLMTGCGIFVAITKKQDTRYK